MLTVVDTSENPAHYSFIEKKSEFIADACHINSLDEAVEFVESIRQQHPKSRHVCYAAIIGADQAQFQERMSDDGEPSGTAGKPILQVLRQSGTTDTVIAVTRYFGGILLGAGGLVRAYSSAAAGVLKTAHVSEVIAAQQFSCTMDYAQYAVMQRIIAQYHGSIRNESFTEKVAIECAIPVDKSNDFENAVEQTFHATIKPIRTEFGSLMG
ncbi:YigZ family protein [Alloscardovia theropitheci]|uniref:YigZ family protein n=1 Tax=Alloscardovia theropitheci TaxID=2496842 RepID=A0A4R0QWN4_9BIFI|nr:YigZ family protein [Alloscardovia theropitheci]TCD53701.1 YigZ family protein [Alloscardovia theropitheci]